MEFNEEEIARFLSDLIKVDTSNPPGNELEAAKLVAEKLGELGFSCEVVESKPRRGSAIARVGEGEPSLLLLSHLDVVPANPEEWKHHPFSGLIKDGYVWGRGALDCKGLVAVELFAFAALASREDLPGTLIFAATADEEKGGRLGAGWLVENRPELVRASYVINEGGGFEIRGSRGSLFTVQTSEKGVYWLRLKFRGKPGHGATPSAGDNAIVKAAEAASNIASRKPRLSPTRQVSTFIKELLSISGVGWAAPLLLNPLTARAALKFVKDRGQAAMLEAMLGNTLAPTVIRGGEKENIIPSYCELVVDCRLLPGYGEEWVKAHLSKVLGADYELEFITRDPPSESPTDTRLYEAIREVLTSEVPGCRVAPFLLMGGTDSRFFRWKFGSVAYGFFPLRSEGPLSQLLGMVHGVNERISIKNLSFSYRVLVKTIERFFDLMEKR